MGYIFKEFQENNNYVPSFLILLCVGAKCCPIDLSSDLDVLERSSSFKWSVSSSSLRQVTLPGATVTQLTWQVHLPSDKEQDGWWPHSKARKLPLTHILNYILPSSTSTAPCKHYYLLYLVESVRKKATHHANLMGFFTYTIKSILFYVIKIGQKSII